MRVGFSTFKLKMIAITAMLIDHVGKAFFPHQTILSAIGRIAFPIFVYLLAEGFVHTHDVKRYMVRLGIFAIVSEIPFDLLFTGKLLEFECQNVFFTLFLGLVMLCLMLKTTSGIEVLLIAFTMILLGEFLRVDYGGMGLLMICWFYQYRERKLLKILGIVIINTLFMGQEQIWAVLALIPITLHYRDEGPKMKWFFYGFYPVHLSVLYLINIIL